VKTSTAAPTTRSGRWRSTRKWSLTARSVSISSGTSLPAAPRSPVRRAARAGLGAGLPVVIHDRDAHRETMNLLKGWKGAGGDHPLLLGITRWPAVHRAGFFISIPGTVTFEKNDKLRSIVRTCPWSRSSWKRTALPHPNPFRGKRNEPPTCPHGPEDRRDQGRPFEEVAAVTTANAKAVFGIP